MAMLLVLCSSSCYQNLSDAPDTPDVPDVSDTPDTPDVPEKKENVIRIVHFSFAGHWNSLPRSIEYFEDPALKLEIIEVDSFDEASYERLQMEIVSGSALDVFLGANLGYPYNSRLFFGLLQQDAFLELEPYLNEWEKLDQFALYPSIMNCIDTDGTCVLLPGIQYMPTLATTKERMEQYGIELDQNPTIKEFKDQIEYYLSQNPDGLVFPMQLTFQYFLYLTGATSVFVDKQNKTSSFNSEEFRTLVECYELISQHQGGVFEDSEETMYTRIESFLKNEALFVFEHHINRFCYTDAYAACLAEAGASVVLHARTSASAAYYGEADSGETVAAQFREKGYDAIFRTADIREASEAEGLVAQAAAWHGRLDIVVNNAGGDIGAHAARPNSSSALEIAPEDLFSVVTRNLCGTMLMCKYAGLYMRERQEGKIINISSQAAHLARPTQAVYAASKAGVEHYTRCLAEELRPYQIHVNCLAVGGVYTGRILTFTQRADEAGLVPLQRMHTKEEMARLILFLAGPDSDALTGETIVCWGK